jgi:hypothetical protein
MIICWIEYTLNPRRLDAFEEYARRCRRSSNAAAES